MLLQDLNYSDCNSLKKYISTCLSNTEISKVMADYPSLNATDLKLQFTAGCIHSHAVY